MNTSIDLGAPRWTAQRKAALVLHLLQGKVGVLEASRTYGLPRTLLETWLYDARKGIEHAMRVDQRDLRDQYERKMKAMQRQHAAELMELRALLGGGETRNTLTAPTASFGPAPAGPTGGAIPISKPST
ncbi:transposase [Ideonella sp. DXS29W]|uniref:Transposase n=1 Tax=Ideonella lacteola TaxID=2984193 RepID=A0ABU9BZ40_9BURK